ncbi:MAG: AMP-binding protein, partial [Hyphomicrobiaceae bacterium]|nr:AMP-binding protein [Hyphomicrobiaceae bacterium]
MSDFLDDAETQSPDAREAGLFAQVPQLIAHAKGNASGWATHLEAIDAEAVTDRDALAKLPVLRKSALMAAQAETPPFGGFVVGGPGTFTRVFVSPGPIYEPQAPGLDPWKSGRALYAAGFRKGDIVHNAFAYHMTPGGFILDEGARALGCAVLPAGVGNTDAQIAAMAALKPAGYIGTPDYLKTLLEAADAAGLDVSSLTKALVSGGALFPSLREWYDARGVSVLQAYATADLGVIAYESPAREGLIVNEKTIVEIVRPGTDEPVPDGEVGEVVVTVFNPVYPLIRFGTGDLSAVLAGPSPCGRTGMRIKGWMG